MLSYAFPRLPLSIVSGYVGLLVGMLWKPDGGEVREVIRKQIQKVRVQVPAMERVENRIFSAIVMGIVVGLVLGEVTSALPQGPQDGGAHARLNAAPNKRPPERYEPTEEPEDSPSCCSICLTNKRDTVIEDCQHLVMCWSCYEQLIDKKCPACQTYISRVIYAFTP
eukprot:TRINITY_DN15899_c0_g1_i2.p1 TRINITY_DN15899_c0_g1~~TRINITY_DN15899_c0_g1_i2.p1  ORF type:complete len:182 (+),score=28.16 TRINITY_DN15899_c0_g1_i2:46-546(+)